MSSKFDVKNLNLYYGEYHALKNVNMEIPEKMITMHTAVIIPVSLLILVLLFFI